MKHYLKNIKTKTNTSLFVGLPTNIETAKEKLIVVLMACDDNDVNTLLTVEQTKELIKELQQNVAYIEKMK